MLQQSWILVVFLWMVAQQPLSEDIRAANVQRLAPVQQIDFATFPTAFTSGWFAINRDATRIVVSDQDGQVYIVDDRGAIVEMIAVPVGQGSYPGSLIDAAFADERVYLLRVLDGLVYLNEHVLDLPSDPISLWVEAGAMQDRVYVELQTSQDGAASVVEYAISDGSLEWVRQFAYVPSTDPQAVVRVGRVMPPYVVTSTLTGLVTLWKLDESARISSVENGTAEPSVFGNINYPPTHFVWRDNANRSLYLLDLNSGENQMVDALNGAYAQWLFLSNDASVILGVNLDFEPVVIAWDVINGTRTTLGSYRPCGRPQPDAARFSEDGSTLVIGCDSGLEIWRVLPQ